MKKTIKVNENYLYIPVKLSEDIDYMEIFCEGEKIYEFRIPYGADYEEMDYMAELPVKQWKGKEITVEGPFPEKFFDRILNDEKRNVTRNDRPKIHFTADYGWINDPNGLLYDGENYHVYFQHNPFHIKWSNMSWGHAVSKDLLHYEQHEDVLYPDQNGMVFSGCGIMKDGKMYFPHTVAGGSVRWSEKEPFIQGLAVSEDHGETLQRICTTKENPLVGVIGKETRDPKVFWHEESQAYVMILYLEENDFGIFRSTNLYDWEMTHRFTAETAWECPNLMPITMEDGTKQWVMLSADGFYYWGDFDGYRFESDLVKQEMYFGGFLYASQSFSGTGERNLNLAWIRLPDLGDIYCGALSLPREMTGRNVDGKMVLIQNLMPEHVKEIVDVSETMSNTGSLQMISVPENQPYLFEILLNGKELVIHVNGSEVCVNPKEKILGVEGQTYGLNTEFQKIQIVMDHHILEILIDDAVLGAFQTKEKVNSLSYQWK